MSQIHELTMIELAAAIRSGELSPVTVTDHYLRRTQELNDQVGAFYTVTAEYAADQALAAEKAVTAAEDKAAMPPLTGVPIPIKDLNMVAGVRQTRGSKAFETNVPDTDDCGGRDQAGRCGHHRQDRHSRVRTALLHRDVEGPPPADLVAAQPGTSARSRPG